MKQMTFFKTAIILSILVLMIPTGVVIAAESDITGQWKLKSTNPDGPPMDAILTIVKGKDGKLAGKWLSFFGPGELKDVKFDAGKLTFVQIGRFGGEEFTVNFNGTLKDGKLTGTMSSERGDMDYEGALMPARSAIVGVWDITSKREDREMKSTLTLTADKDGKLSGVWKSQRGEGNVSDVNFKDGKLTFKRSMNRQDQTFEINYELIFKDDTLAGTSKTPRGETALTGKRADVPAVGTWELTIVTERWGERKQILTIFPDLTAMYGPADLDKLTVDGAKISFKQSRTFGEWKFDEEFNADIVGDQLTGQLTFTGREGPVTQKVTGKKLASEK